MLFLLSTSALSLQNLFLQFDSDKSGTTSSYELRTALKAAGKEKPGLPTSSCLQVGYCLWEPLASRGLEKRLDFDLN